MRWVIGILVLAAAAFGVWFFFLRRQPGTVLGSADVGRVQGAAGRTVPGLNPFATFVGGIGQAFSSGAKDDGATVTGSAPSSGTGTTTTTRRRTRIGTAVLEAPTPDQFRRSQTTSGVEGGLSRS